MRKYVIILNIIDNLGCQLFFLLKINDILDFNIDVTLFLFFLSFE